MDPGRSWVAGLRRRQGRDPFAPGAGMRSAVADLVAARARIVAWAATLAGDPRTVYLDTETTGLGGSAEVVDLAVVAGDGLVLLDTLVRPTAPIPPDASAIHGIFDADVAGAPSWPEVHDHLCRLLAGRPIVVYNADFDRRLLAQTGRRYGLELPDLIWECAMRAYARFRGDRDGRGGYRLHTLARAALTFGARPGGHRAAADALACRAVVIGMAQTDLGQP